MAPPPASCADITRVISLLRSGAEKRADTRAAVAVWLGLFAFSLTIGGLISLGVWLRRRAAYGPVPFPLMQCLWTSLLAALAGWYPAVLLHVLFRRRISRDATRLLRQCADTALKTTCEKLCGDLKNELSIPTKSGYESLFFLLIVGVPPLVSAVFCAYCVFSLCSKYSAHANAEGAPHALRPVDDAERNAAIEAASRSVVARGAEDGETECPICLDELWSRTVVEIPCGHQFHRNCMCRWLYGGPSLSCPLCKTPVVGGGGGVAEP